ncbi:MAG: S49 family peptidase [Gammaproteobacteria bacterium]
MANDEHDNGEAAGQGSGDGARSDQWHRELVERLAFASLNEQRRARRWGILFKGLFFLLAFAVLGLAVWNREPDHLMSVRHTAMVDVDGLIAQGADASAERVIKGLRAAFDDSGTAGVIVRINSPGGSPVQAGYINDEIRRLRAEHPRIPVYAVVADMCASGGYYVAVAADRIYANKASIVGSIGVRMDSFGFVDALKKLGIERRLLTAGQHKGMLDPFLPENKADVQRVQSMLDAIHQQFIEAVKQGRGKRLADNPEIFSGMVWTGAGALKLGLIDGLGSPGYVARKVIGASRIVDYTPRQDLWQRLSDRVGVSLGRGLGSVLESSGPVLR